MNVRRLIDQTLEEHDRPRDQIALLERQTNCLPTLRAELVEADRGQATGCLLQPRSIIQGNNQVFPFRLHLSILILGIAPVNPSHRPKVVKVGWSWVLKPPGWVDVE